MRVIAAPVAAIYRGAIPAVFRRVDADAHRADQQAYATLHERTAVAIVVAVLIIVLRVRSRRARKESGAGNGRKHETFHLLFLPFSLTEATHECADPRQENVFAPLAFRGGY